MWFDRRCEGGFLPELPWVSVRWHSCENSVASAGLGDAQPEFSAGIRLVVR